MQLKASLQTTLAIFAVAGVASAAPSPFPTADKAPARGNGPTIDYLALFFKNWDFFGEDDEDTAIKSGQAWPGQGQFSTCYDIVPDWVGQKVGSIKLSPAVESCWFYFAGNTDCTGTVAGQDYWPIDAADPDMVGKESDFGVAVGSWICFPWE